MQLCGSGLHAWRRELVLDEATAAAAPARTELMTHWLCLACGAHRYDRGHRGAERRRSPRSAGVDAAA